MGRLIGKVAIITGGAASIGAAITRKFHSEGARIVIAARGDGRDRNRAEPGGHFVAENLMRLQP